MSDPGPNDDPLRVCAYSGIEKPQSHMVQIGGHWIATEHKDAAVQYLQQGSEFEARVHGGLKETPVRLGVMLNRSWELFRKHSWLLVALHLTIALPMNLLDSFVFGRLNTQLQEQVRREGTFPPAYLLLLFIPMATAIVSSFGSAAIMAALSRSWSGARPDYGGALAATARRAISVLAASFMTMLLFMAGLILCVIPGIVALVKLTFCECYVMDRGVSGAESLGCSFRLTKGRFWIVLGCMVLVSVITIAPPALMSAGLESIYPIRDLWEVQGILQTILSVPGIFITVFTFVFYKALIGPGAEIENTVPPSSPAPVMIPGM